MTDANKAYIRIIALTNQIGTLGEELEIVTKEYIEAKESENDNR